jgi:hypothetical protein
VALKHKIAHEILVDFTRKKRFNHAHAISIICMVKYVHPYTVPAPSNWKILPECRTVMESASRHTSACVCRTKGYSIIKFSMVIMVLWFNLYLRVPVSQSN